MTALTRDAYLVAILRGDEDQFAILCDHDAALRARLATLEAELALIRKAADDTTLTDYSVRIVAGGLDKITDKDIEWAKAYLAKHRPSPQRGSISETES